ncbi:hypothetical protein [Pseudomonas putida]|uniref:Uncharacterized protein n=1 Tax=Pseudomonas putida TaxID=303 RepID=A0A8I1EBN0_PSEPU|nr:hypothetical protein [Pseudomonas putida]MBI6882536.1 hypothetical protein [Pseudomonas putida]
MMGINPLTDALLIQSLKTGSAAPSDKSVTPVVEAEGGQGTREVKSDSRLNDRPYHNLSAYAGYGPSRGYLPGSSTVITLNETAKLIADIMVKYPLVDSRLLIQPLAELQIGKAGVLSSHLQRLVAFSGLFYESHLASWFKGDYPEALLRLEPQYSLFKGSDHRAQTFIDPPGLSIRGAEERMMYMIRHQLEILDRPNLQFAGTLIPGLPVQLWMQQVVLPVAINEHGEQLHSSSALAFGWKVLFRIEHRSFDYIDFALSLLDRDLSVKMTGNHAVIQEWFKRDQAELIKNLADIGIGPVHFYRQLMSRLEVKPEFRIQITAGSTIPVSKAKTAIEQEYGVEAEHIFYRADQKGMTTHQSHELFGLLMKLNTDQKIPLALYSVIEILTYWAIEQIQYLSD